MTFYPTRYCFASWSAVFALKGCSAVSMEMQINSFLAWRFRLEGKSKIADNMEEKWEDAYDYYNQ